MLIPCCIGLVWCRRIWGGDDTVRLICDVICVQTTLTSAQINDITPGHWYQFRVTAVNIYGSRGGSQPTTAFTLSKGLSQ